jgi:hypothetical protein
MQIAYSLTVCLYTIFAFVLLRAVQLFALPALLLNYLGVASQLQKGPYAVLFVSGGLFVWAGWHLDRDALNMANLASFGLTWLFFLNCFLISAAELVGDTRYRPKEMLRLLTYWPYRWIAQRMIKPIDVFFVRQLLAVTLALLFPFVAMIVQGHLALVWVIPYLLCLDVTSSSYENIDHTDIHNNIFKFKPSGSILEVSILWILRVWARWGVSCICLRIPKRYRIQHVYIHHVENNGPDDNQSTVMYDRKSFLDFCRFSLKFGIDLAFPIFTVLYLARRRRMRLARPLLGGGCAWVIFLLTCNHFCNNVALLFVALQVMFGVFAVSTAYVWHALVDTDTPSDVYRNSVNIIPTAKEAGLFGALHIRHHLRGGEHWSNQIWITDDEYALCKNNGAALLDVPSSTPRFTLLKALWLRQFDVIAGLYFPGEDVENAKIRVEERTKPLVARPGGPIYMQLDRILGQVVASLLL